MDVVRLLEVLFLFYFYLNDKVGSLFWVKIPVCFTSKQIMPEIKNLFAIDSNHPNGNGKPLRILLLQPNLKLSAKQVALISSLYPNSVIFTSSEKVTDKLLNSYFFVLQSAPNYNIIPPEFQLSFGSCSCIEYFELIMVDLNSFTNDKGKAIQEKSFSSPLMSRNFPFGVSTLSNEEVLCSSPTEFRKMIGSESPIGSKFVKTSELVLSIQNTFGVPVILLTNFGIFLNMI